MHKYCILLLSAQQLLELRHNLLVRRALLRATRLQSHFAREGKQAMRRLVLLLVAACLLCAFAFEVHGTQTTVAITQVWQHKDTSMPCALGNLPGLPATRAHSWDCANLNACPYCEAYCAPAAAAMIGLFQGQTSPYVDIDNIYDNAKVQGEIMSNGILETRGVGMYAGIGTTPPEVQNAFTYSAGVTPYQLGPLGSPNPLMIYDIVRWYIDHNQPILWVDIGNWPLDQEVLLEELEYDSGHCKVIAGYDDLDTAGWADDLLLIYDPWPNSGSPYWQGHGLVVDLNDVYLTMIQVAGVESKSWGRIKSMYAN
jgi:hypothetical protein